MQQQQPRLEGSGEGCLPLCSGLDGFGSGSHAFTGATGGGRHGPRGGQGAVLLDGEITDHIFREAHGPLQGCHLLAVTIVVELHVDAFAVRTLENTIFLGTLMLVLFALVQSLRGKEAEIPTVSEAVRMQLY